MTEVFAFSFTRFNRFLFQLFGASQSKVEVGPELLMVEAGALFRARIAVSTVSSVTKSSRRVRLTAGAHGFRGRWLVNGSPRGLVDISCQPAQRGYVLRFIPVRIRTLTVGVLNPEALISTLEAKRSQV